MTNLESIFQRFDTHHQNVTHRVLTFVSFPILWYGIVGMFWSMNPSALVNLFPYTDPTFLNWALVVVLVTLLFYFTVSQPLFFGMAAIFTGFLVLTNILVQMQLMDLGKLSAILFLSAGLLLFIGSKLDKEKLGLKPTQLILYGPLWCLSKVFKVFGINF